MKITNDGKNQIKSVSELEKELRDLINCDVIINGLLQDKIKWFQLCSSMDVIGDTQLAIDAYLIGCDGIGMRYLQLYGLLQCMIVQQDAIKGVREIACPNYEFDSIIEEEIKKIREIRNKAIGHPTKKRIKKEKNKKQEKEENGDRKSKHMSYFIVRNSLKKNGFTLFEDMSQKEQVDIYKLIKMQDTLMRRILNGIITQMNEDVVEHRAKFADQKIEDTFSQTGYYCGKVFDGIRNRDKIAIAKNNLGMIEECICRFKEELKKRNISVDAYTGLKDGLEKVKRPINELYRLFGSSENDVDTELEEIFAFFLSKKLNGLRDIANDIDKEYAN